MTSVSLARFALTARFYGKQLRQGHGLPPEVEEHHVIGSRSVAEAEPGVVRLERLCGDAHVFGHIGVAHVTRSVGRSFLILLDAAVPELQRKDVERSGSTPAAELSDCISHG